MQEEGMREAANVLRGARGLCRGRLGERAWIVHRMYREGPRPGGQLFLEARLGTRAYWVLRSEGVVSGCAAGAMAGLRVLLD